MLLCGTSVSKKQESAPVGSVFSSYFETGYSRSGAVVRLFH